MSDILLMTPGSRTNTMRMPLGLMSLSATLSRNGVSSKIVDLKNDPEANRNNIRAVAKHKPWAVGITVVATEVYEVRDLCSDIRRESPKTKIILGGPGPTYRPDHYIEARVPCDYLVLGEADFTIVEVMRSLLGSNGRDIPGVAGAYHISAPELERNAVARPKVEDISSLPYPAYDKVDMEFYCRPSVWAIRFVYLSGLSIITSRGCPFTCKFCVVPNIYGRSIRLRTPEQAVTQAQFLVDKYAIDALYWMDEVFTGNKKWAAEVCRLLKERNVNVKWGCQTRAHLVDEDLMRLMRSAGCIQIDTGYESGSDRMLGVIDKGVKATSDLYLRFAGATRRTGLRTFGNMMINLPTETMEDVDLSIAFLKKSRPHVSSWAPYIPIPGVSFGQQMELDDLDRYGGNRAELAVLEDKYKFAQYDTPLRSVMERIWRTFPYPPQVRLTFNPMYWWRWLRYFNYVFTWWYWLLVWKSKRRGQYFNTQYIRRMMMGR